ncbi:Hypothetical protein NTJ_03235 [Nesidiocoris tenuis]|uniref:Uncharacterized protein n=1 Tax=Nesidiocoris tenuis TaxID=355587 RepID=A0ABN7AJA1_9HEMI|nr:Hypothetical protein NTJ_03235 [Nesidiocoris tenuis]
MGRVVCSYSDWSGGSVGRPFGSIVGIWLAGGDPTRVLPSTGAGYNLISSLPPAGSAPIPLTIFISGITSSPLHPRLMIASISESGGLPPHSCRKSRTNGHDAILRIQSSPVAVMSLCSRDGL